MVTLTHWRHRMIVLTTECPDAGPTAVDITTVAGIAALTLLPEGGDHGLAVALTPSEARRLSGELARFAERDGA